MYMSSFFFHSRLVHRVARLQFISWCFRICWYLCWWDSVSSTSRISKYSWAPTTVTTPVGGRWAWGIVWTGGWACVSTTWIPPLRNGGNTFVWPQFYINWSSNINMFFLAILSISSTYFAHLLSICCTFYSIYAVNEHKRSFMLFYRCFS